MAIWSLRLRPVWSLAPTSPASSVTRRSTAVWMSSSSGAKAKVPAVSSASTWSRASSRAATSSSVSSPPRPSPRTWAREPARSSWARRRSKSQADRVVHDHVGHAAAEPTVPQGHDEAPESTIGRAATLLHRRPGGHAQTPQAHEALGVLVAEGVGGVVGGQAVVVEADRAAPAHHPAPAGLEAEAHLAGDVALGLDEEGVEGLLERGEPQAVVDQLRPARLEPELLVVEVALQGEVLQVGVGQEQGQGARAFVRLAALDADPAVLHHVEAAEAVGADHPVQLGDERLGGQGGTVQRDRHPGLEADRRSRSARWPSGGSWCTRPRAAGSRGPR